jgi:predicted branched-subunit amino acid permease
VGTVRAGASAAVPFALAAIAVGVSFGVLAVEAGFPRRRPS